MKVSKFQSSQRTPAEDHQYRLKAAGKIMMLLEPVKSLSTSRLSNLRANQLDEIGKAARELYEVLSKVGINTRSRSDSHPK